MYSIGRHEAGSLLILQDCIILIPSRRAVASIRAQAAWPESFPILRSQGNRAIRLCPCGV